MKVVSPSALKQYFPAVKKLCETFQSLEYFPDCCTILSSPSLPTPQLLFIPYDIKVVSLIFTMQEEKSVTKDNKNSKQKEGIG